MDIRLSFVLFVLGVTCFSIFDFFCTAYTSQPYSEIIYYPDPLSRVQYQKPVGWSSQNEWIEYQYSSTTVNGVLLSYTDKLQTVGSNTGQTDTRVYTDNIGREVRTETFVVGSGDKDVSTTIYDMAGNPVSITDPNGYVSTSSYRPYLNRLMESNNVDKGITKYAYNTAGQLRFMVDAFGLAASPDKTLYWKYDALGRVIEKGYINVDWSTAIQNVQNAAYPSTPATWRKKYDYDDFSTTPYAQGKLCKVRTNNDDDNNVEVEETFQYDKFGNTASASSNVADYSADSYNAVYSYDNLGRVTQIDYPLYKTVSSVQNLTVGSSSEYDASSPTTMTVGPSVTIQNGGIANLSAKDGITLNPGFTASTGSTVKASTNTYMIVKYTYNQLGQVTGVGNDNNNNYFGNYSYNFNGTLFNEKLNNLSLSNSYSYNPRGFLTAVACSVAVGYTYNNIFTENLAYANTNTYYNGSLALASFIYGSGEPANYSYTYQYDWNNRMTSALNNVNSSYSFSNIRYDNNGNVTNRQQGSSYLGYSYSGSNRISYLLLNGGKSVYNFYYDSDGNITNNQYEGIIATYDPFTMMTNSMFHGIDVVSYQYNGRKERILKTVNGTEKTLYLRGTNDYPLTEKTSSANRFYIYGPTGLIAMVDNGNTYFMLKDHLGSVRVVLDEDNSVSTRYDYSPYGSLIFPSSIGEEAHYRFTSQEYDPETDLFNFRARMYDSHLGIFYAGDPAGQGFSPYSYCGGNPTMYVDKDGRLAWFVIPIIVGAITGAVNVATHWDQIQQKGFWEGAKAFGIGFGAGFVGTLTGTEAFFAAGGGAAGAGGWFAGAFGGFWGSATSVPFESYLNTAAFGDAPLTWQQYALTVGVSTFTGGAINGTSALVNGRNFWNGELPAISDATNVVTNTLPNGLSDPKVAENYSLASKQMQGEISTNNKYSVYAGYDKSGSMKYVGITKSTSHTDCRAFKLNWNRKGVFEI